MASLGFPIVTTPLCAAVPSSPFSKTTTDRRFKTPTKQNRCFKVSCNARELPNHDNAKPAPQTPKLILPKTSLDMQNVDRRNLLLGLGGLYGATVNGLPSAFADPITTVSNCDAEAEAKAGIRDPENAVRTKKCCPPVTTNPIKDFVFPRGPMRTRPVAHLATPAYVAKYKAAIEAMKKLPDDHPHSFIQQAKIHCAYCNGGYLQSESTKILQIHNSWLFFPFHRWYLYFYERILGKLIDDPTFALPYWNWDHPMGMTIPGMFEEGGKKNTLFDGYRSATHLPPAVVDLNYDGSDSGASCIEQIDINLSCMYRQMFSNASDPLCFFGGKYKAGDDAVDNGDPSVGSIEAGCHTAVHRWVGDSRMPNNEDLGNFYSAGYDPLFYVHHANVDRMWFLWKRLGKGRHKEPRDTDWLYASYLFYDENGDMVRVNNKDCVRMEKLKYQYERSETPWTKNRPHPHKKKSRIAARSVGKVTNVEEIKFPVKLDQTVKVLVKRPATKRSGEDKEDDEEVLVVNGVMFDSEKFVKFDVYANDEEDYMNKRSAANSEFAGSFAQIPHNSGGSMLMKSAVRFGITELLEDIECEDDELVLVTLVPRSGCEEVTVSEIKIELGCEKYIN